MDTNKNLKITNEEKGVLNLSLFNVNTKEIYKFLNIKTEYRHWIKRLIDKLELIENVDYISRSIPDRLSKTGQTQKIYYITKGASLLLRQEVAPDGLEIQKKTNDFTIAMAEALKDPIKLGEMLIGYGKHLKEQQKQIETLTTNIKKLEGNDLDVLYYAKDVGAELGISAIKLNKFLEEQKIIYKQNGHWHIYVKFAKENLLIEVKEKIKNSNLYVSILKITPKGRIFIKDLWGKING